jgi:hypothetical protein
MILNELVAYRLLDRTREWTGGRGSIRGCGGERGEVDGKQGRTSAMGGRGSIIGL